MKRNNGIVTEVAHLRGDQKAYDNGYDRIFGKKSNDLELIVGKDYFNVKDRKIYTIVSFIFDRDEEKEKVLFCNEDGEQFSRSLPRFRQKFKDV